MWNIRMRASKKDSHISGAEGIYDESEIPKISAKYIKRALNHPRGKPDGIVISIEEIKQKPKTIPLLPVTTLECRSPAQAEKIISKTLRKLDISNNAIISAIKIIRSKKTMRGAGLIRMKSGTRAEPDKIRGVRVSRFGIKKSAERTLSNVLAKLNINTTTVKEALILASKVSSCKGIIAEICISDDPDYTTGYIASREGYLRITNIKKKREMHGGRIFFMKEDSDAEKIIYFLEKQTVLLK